VSTVTEIKKAVTTLSEAERYELMRWLEAEQAEYGNISDAAFVQNAAEMLQMLDREEDSQDALIHKGNMPKFVTGFVMGVSIF